MTMPPESPLERTAEAVADGTPLDRVPDAADPHLSGLRVLEQIGEAYGRARRAHDAFAPDALLDDATPPAFVWGFLRVLSRIGEGSFGEVWRAYDPSLQREVALKLRRIDPLPPGASALALSSDPETRRTLDEARRLARVHHPHVLTVFGAAEHDGRAGVWTELIHGETLEGRLRAHGPLSVAETAGIGHDLCGALAAVHAAGLTHGDIKGANVMLETATGASARPRLVLMDFGAAHERERVTGPAAGTPLLMAPEVLAGEGSTPRSDLYSVGALLHQLVTGRYPVEDDTLEGLRSQHARGVPPVMPAGVPSPIARIIARALEPDPARRFASAEEMQQALAHLATRRSSWLVRGTIAAVLLAVAGIGVAWVQSRRPSPSRFLDVASLPGTIGAPLVPADTLTGEPGAGLGWITAACGDLDGDGCAEVLIASTSYTGTLFAQGRVQLYRGSRDGRFGAPVETWLGDQAGIGFANAMSVVGDLDHDGHPEVLMSDLYVDSTSRHQLGSVSLFRGRPGGFEPQRAWRITGTQDGGHFGQSIAAVGDVNGDGYIDVAISADHDTRRFPGEGAVFLYPGTPQGLSRTPSWAAWGGGRNAGMGYHLAKIGDVNGDGFDDLVIGIPHWSGGNEEERGRVELFYGGPRGPGPRPDWVVDGDQPGGLFGRHVVGAGDVNGDGSADFLVTQENWSGRSENEGRVLLFLGGPHGPRRDPAWIASGYGTNAALGSAIAVPGDMDGDGRADLATGAFEFCNGTPNRPVGLCTVHYGGAGAITFERVRRLAGSDPGTPIGENEVAIGDFNGDGLADLLVTQPRYPIRFTTTRGRVYLILGQRSGPRR